LSVLISIISLPAVVIVLALAPELAGYLVISASSLLLIMVGEVPRNDDEKELEELPDLNSREAILVISIFYAMMALPFSALLILSAGAGHLVMSNGYPAAGLVIAAAFPYIDHWTAGKHQHLSVVNLAAEIIARLVMMVSIIYAIPNRFPSMGWDNHRRRMN